ncbi:lipid IV(A) 3-deoxy-D-manno-octulosonic acid transferase [Candidatus Venteria ishoeyi]|uniref:3-deoxy-D-manno-octulosonic acid transferase n=1 Tax=Candidatus Venteria ishoeyi TaxID=1899563 RepID=A0A1H6F2P4_9GAMM|nr:lipid IV(A) 3-deoxy-D-manno-octulosonic acid transferase [Candidatus Venteria ishoeyi]SEH04427.1 3-deoxy-D-manno-octulosonic acid transferase [Candidatus Venteria ishoeyi]
MSADRTQGSKNTLSYAYTSLLYLLLPAILIRLWWRGRKAPAYRQRWIERFAWHLNFPRQPRIWVHAVSFGETQAALPLIKALQQRYPNHSLLVTSMTPTGSAHVSKTLGHSVEHVYLPYDYPGAVRRLLDATQPQLGIIMETEWWPNLFFACKQRNIPLLLANARLSERSARAYQRFAPQLTARTLACLSAIAAQGESDAQRLLALGAKPETLTVTGSIKFDLELAASIQQQAQVFRQQWAKRPVWIAASTHEGEEQIILQAAKTVLATLPDSLLILVPRHPERFEQVFLYCQQAGLKTVRRSSGQTCNAATQVFLGDSMGELMALYASSDVAFIGGSLIGNGGHNPLEPAALSLPVMFGPSMFNFAQISSALLQAQAAVQLEGQQALARQVTDWLSDKTQSATVGENGAKFVVQNRGALQKLMQLVAKCLV